LGSIFVYEARFKTGSHPRLHSTIISAAESKSDRDVDFVYRCFEVSKLVQFVEGFDLPVFISNGCSPCLIYDE
jgi:hypothetical protein